MVTLGRPVIVRTVQGVERTASIVELQTILQKSRESKIQMKPKPRLNNVDDTSLEAATMGTSATVGEQMNQVQDMMQRHCIYDANCDSAYDDFDDNCVAVISDNDDIRSGAGKIAYSIRKHQHKSISGFGKRLHYHK